MGNEGLSKDLVLLGKQFNRIMKHVIRRPRPNGQNIRFNNDQHTKNDEYVKPDENINQYKGVQCDECEGYGHIRT